ARAGRSGEREEKPSARCAASSAAGMSLWVGANTRTRSPAHRADAGPKAAQQAPRFPSSPTHFPSLLLLLLLLAVAWLFPTVASPLSASWGYRRIGTVGGMDAAIE